MKIVGTTLLVGGWILPWVANMDQDTMVTSIVTGTMLGGVILLVGFLIPRLEDCVDSNSIYRVGFTRSGLLLISGASKELLRELPMAKAAWYHGILGFESITLPDPEKRIRLKRAEGQ